MTRDGLIFDVRGNSGGTSRSWWWRSWPGGSWAGPWAAGGSRTPTPGRRGAARWSRWPTSSPGPTGTSSLAAVKLLGLGPVVGTPHLGRRDRDRGSAGTGRRLHRQPCRGTAFYFDEYGWGVENHGVDPDVEVLITPDEAAAGRDTQLETAVQLAMDALDKQPRPALPEVTAGPVKSRRPPAAPPRGARRQWLRCPMTADPVQLRTRRIWALTVMFCVAVIVLTADAISKQQVLARLSGHPPVRLLHGLLTLDLTFNAGAAFGVGTSYTAIIALIVCGVIAYIIRIAAGCAAWPGRSRSGCCSAGPWATWATGCSGGQDRSAARSWTGSPAPLPVDVQPGRRVDQLRRRADRRAGAARHPDRRDLPGARRRPDRQRPFDPFGRSCPPRRHRPAP